MRRNGQSEKEREKKKLAAKAMCLFAAASSPSFLFRLTAALPAERRRASEVVCGSEGEKPSAWVPSSEPEEAVVTTTNGRRRRVGVVGINVIDICRRGWEEKEEGDERARSGAAVLAAVTFDSSLLLLLLLLQRVAEPTPARRELMFLQIEREKL